MAACGSTASAGLSKAHPSKLYDSCDCDTEYWFRCNTCNFGQFDICPKSIKQGHWCLYDHHQMLETDKSGKASLHSRGNRNAPIASPWFECQKLPVAHGSNGFIRLLTIRKGGLNDGLVLELETFGLDGAPEFEALVLLGRDRSVLTR